MRAPDDHVAPESNDRTDHLPGTRPAERPELLSIGCTEAESAVLSCVLRLPVGSARELVARIAVDDFIDPRHQAVLAAATELLHTGVPADPITVLGQLRRSGAERSFTADKSAAVYVIELLAAAPATTSAGWYIDVLIEHSARRRIEAAALRMSQQAGTLALGELVALADQEWSAIRGHLSRCRAQREGWW